MLTSAARTHLTRFFLSKVSTQALQSTKTTSSRPPLSSLFRTMAQLQKAVVRSLPDQPNLTITLTIGGKQRNLDRPKSEPLEKPLSRIQKTSLGGGGRVNKKSSGNNNTKKSSTSADTSTSTTSSSNSHVIFLYDGPSSSFPPLDPATTSNEAAWCKSGRLLVIGEESWTVEVNPPTITSLSVLGMKCFVDIPICPVPLLQFANEEDCHWQWYYSSSSSSDSAGINAAKAMKDGYHAIEGATHRLFIPTQDLIGKKIKVECIPVRREEDSSMAMVGEGMSTDCGTVLPHPSGHLSAKNSTVSSKLGRHQYTQHYTQSPDIRIMTYNLLADQYASTEAAKNRIFAHCPTSFLQPDYRRPLVLGEILGYKADVICLQEVDEKMFSQLLQPALKVYGYEGMYTNKAGAVREGSAMFWNSKRYKLAASHEFALKHLFSYSSGGSTRVKKPATPASVALEERSVGYQKVFENMLSSSPALTHALQRVGTVAQMALLQPIIITDDNGSGTNSPPSSSPPLMVANTHLFYHARAPHIRTMHTWGIIQEAHAFIQQYQKDNHKQEGQEPALIFCGDLNSDLNDGIPGAIHLLSHGHLPADHWDWFFGMEFSMSARGATQSTITTNNNGGEELIEEGAMDQEVNKMLQHAPAVHPTSSRVASSPSVPTNIVPGVDLSLPLSSLQAADELKSPVTNCVQGYQGLLDYIWYDGRYLQRKGHVPVPVLKEGEYLPSERYPSDHIAVVHTLTTSGGGGQSGGGQSGGDNNNSTPLSTTRILPARMYNVGIAAETLKEGKIIAVPTDTLYGLAAAASDSSAIQGIYALKQRKDTKPLAICVADVEDIQVYGEISHLPEELLSRLLPGPVTVILRQQPDAPLASDLSNHGDNDTNGRSNNTSTNTIAVRIPDNQFIRGICRQHRGAVALTSANLSGGPSSLSVDEFKPLWPACGVVFDGGKLQPVQHSGSHGNDGSDDVSHVGRNGSTIIDLSIPISSSDGEKKRYRIVRDGVALEETRRVMTEHGFVEEE